MSLGAINEGRLVAHLPSQSRKLTGKVFSCRRSPCGQRTSLQNFREFSARMSSYFLVRKLYTLSSSLVAHGMDPKFPKGYDSCSSNAILQLGLTCSSATHRSFVVSQFDQRARCGMSRCSVRRSPFSTRNTSGPSPVNPSLSRPQKPRRAPSTGRAQYFFDWKPFSFLSPCHQPCPGRQLMNGSSRGDGWLR